jgi:3-oxocholest-4-en-26-oyl-CoA dehydrogenase beta subunit
VARFGDDEQRSRWLPGAGDGTTILSVGLHEPAGAEVPDLPSTAVTSGRDGWRLEGEKSVVPAAGRASRILVPARSGERGTGVFLVDPSAPGCELVENVAVSGEPLWTLRFHDVEIGPGDVLGDPTDGGPVASWLTQHLMAMLCAAQTGVCEEALALTARHVSEREQFGAKLGTFQAVAQRIADAYIDTEAIRLTTMQAAWRLSTARDACDELLIAKYWAAEGAQRVVHAAQHLHGGIGVDTDHPIHRYFRWAKVLELTLGGASLSLRRLGASLAARPVPT